MVVARDTMMLPTTAHSVSPTKKGFRPQKSAACETIGLKTQVNMARDCESQTDMSEPPTTNAIFRAYFDSSASKNRLQKGLTNRP